MFGWTGVLTRLGPLENSHAPEIREILSDPAVFLNAYGFVSLPSSLERLAQRFIEEQPNRQNFGIFSLDGTTLFGFVECVYDRLSVHGSAGVSIVVGRDFQRRGIATDARITQLDYLFSEVRAHRVTGVLLESNYASKRMSEKMGVEFCGTYKDLYYTDGRYWNGTAWWLSQERFYGAVGQALENRARLVGHGACTK